MEIGKKVAFAAVGTSLSGGLILQAKEIRGVLSEGMLCSAMELGLGGEGSGLLVFDDDVPIGQTLTQVLKKKKDLLFDIDNKSLTHRPDLWCHYGMAREFAAAFEKELKKPFDQNWMKTIVASFTRKKSPILPVIERGTCCQCYLGLTVDNITVGKSPAWMVERLEACGLRSVNNIVDISNYVMLELGIPNHIFDFDCIEGAQIIIRPSGREQPFTTLDGVERELLATDTVISDASKPLVIGGIMGGLNSGVTENTKKIFIEVANWEAAWIRKSSARLGLRTDSSQRYEKSMDSSLCERTMFRLAELVMQQNPGATIVGKIERAGDIENKAFEIQTGMEKICRVLGKKIEEEKIISIFASLDFGVKREKDLLTITVPSYRATRDVECEADLIEEIGRIIGYNHIEPVSPLNKIESQALRPAKKIHRAVQDYMVLHTQALEILTYPLVGKALLEKASWPVLNKSLVLANAVSAEQDRMRPSMIPSILAAAALNAKRFAQFKLFELGRSYHEDEKHFSRERNQLVLAIYDKEKSVLRRLINEAEGLLRYLGRPWQTFEAKPSQSPNPFLPASWVGRHPREVLDIEIEGKHGGCVFTVHPLILKRFKIRGSLSLFLLDLVVYEGPPLKRQRKFQPIAKFPHSLFDVTVLAGKQVPLEQILSTLQREDLPNLTQVKIADVFSLSDDKNAITLRVTFADEHKTLSAQALKEKEEAVVSLLEKSGFFLKR